MGVELNHTIVAAVDGAAAAEWFADVFGLPAPTRFGHFWQIRTANGVDLDFATRGPDGEPFTRQHYAFLVSEEEFDRIFGRVLDLDLDHWADPGGSTPGEINRRDGGRGVYFPSPDGHLLEIITRPYGG